jgi:hypothetical protein
LELSVFIQLLSSQVDERIREQAVLALRIMSEQEESRAEFMKNKQLISTLLACASEIQTRNSVLAIIQSLAQSDADSLEQEQLEFVKREF